MARTMTRWLVVPALAALCVAAVVVPLISGPVQAANVLRDLADAKGVKIGSAVGTSQLASDQKYQDVLGREFNSVTAENAMKWDATEPQRGQFSFSGADAIVNFAVAHNQRIRGHNLVWHQQLPSWLTGGNFGATDLRQILQTHIGTVAGRYAGKVAQWDVVNEPLNEDGSLRSTIWSQTLGSTYIADALRLARQADPNAKLFLNDFNIEGVNSKSTAMLNLVSSLEQQGVPIDGVGFEAHLVLGSVPPSLQQNIARFTSLGVDVELTELDVRMQLPATTDKLNAQASDYRSVVGACLAVARCTGVTVWEFTDKYSWVPGTFSGQGAADIFDENIDPKPAYGAVLQTLGGTPVTPTPTATPTPAPTPTPTPTPSAGGTGGVTVTAVVSSSSPWFNEEQVRLDNTGGLTAMALTIVIQRTTGISFNGLYNTVGGQILQSNSSTSATITYQFNLASGQTLGAGTGRVFAAQTSGTGTAHPTAGDTFTLTYTTSGASFTQTGHF